MVAVEDQPARWLPCLHRLIERTYDEPHSARFAERPAQYAARVSIHHDSQVAIVAADLQVSDVTDPDLINSRELSFTGPIRNRGMEALHRPPIIAAGGYPGLNAVQLHQSGDAIL